MTVPDGRYAPDPLEVRPEDASETEDILAGALDEDDVAPEDRPREALVLDEPIRLDPVSEVPEEDVIEQHREVPFDEEDWS